MMLMKLKWKFMTNAYKTIFLVLFAISFVRLSAQTVTQQYIVTKSYQKAGEQGTFYDAIDKANAFFATTPVNKTFEVLLNVPSYNILIDTILPKFDIVKNGDILNLVIKPLSSTHTISIDTAKYYNATVSPGNCPKLYLFYWNQINPSFFASINVDISSVNFSLIIKPTILNNGSDFSFYDSQGYMPNAVLKFKNLTLKNSSLLTPNLNLYTSSSDFYFDNSKMEGFKEVAFRQFRLGNCNYPFLGVYIMEIDPRVIKVNNAKIECESLHIYYNDIQLKNCTLNISKLTGFSGEIIDFTNNVVNFKALPSNNAYNGAMMELYTDVDANNTLNLPAPDGFYRMINKVGKSNIQFNHSNKLYVTNSSTNPKPCLFFDLKQSDHVKTIKVLGQKFPGSFAAERTDLCCPGDSIIFRACEISGGIKDYPIITYKLTGANNKITDISVDGIKDELNLISQYDFSTTANEDAYKTVFNKTYPSISTSLDSIGTIFTDIYLSNSNGDLFEWIAADTLKGTNLSLTGSINKSIKLFKKTKLKDGSRIAVTYTVLPTKQKKKLLAYQTYGTFVPLYFTFKQDSCNLCVPQFSLEQNKKYVISAWVREPAAAVAALNYSGTVSVDFFNTSASGVITALGTVSTFSPTGPFVEGWQKIEGEFTVPATPGGQTPIQPISMNIKLNAGTLDAYFDDIRVHAYDGMMQTFVYNPNTLRLEAVLDERNYASMYEYNEEGQLIRVKKETERGIMTIKESRMSTRKNPNP
jgi:hypothetical protein